ncbi:MAG: ISL3 family transposase [Erysipelotrichaceae bacterium]|nr:ISL3 family transposase [Erysipelotrichaceae bacterium]
MKNLIYNLFNIDEESIEKFESLNEDGDLLIRIRMKMDQRERICPVCQVRLCGNGVKDKVINHKILTDRNCTLIYEARRYRCKKCDYSEFERNPFAMNGFNNSIPVMNQVMIDLHDPRYNYTMVAKKNHISATQVIRYFDSFALMPKIPLPENLGIDEIHSKMAKRKDASYLCVLTDNDHFSLVDILPSRSKYELNNYLSFRSKEERKAVRYVTIDMWEPYEEMAHKWFPDCVVAIDPFHVIEHLYRDFTRIRIRIMKSKIYGSRSYYLLKNWHKLLESDRYKMDGERRYNHVFRMKLNYGDIYKMLLEIDEELTTAYELKEAYRDFNKHCNYEQAEEKLDELIALFQKENIREYEEFVNIMIRWKKQIINSFIRSDVTGDRLSNAKSESMNQQISLNISLSKGLANFPRFRKRMLYCFNDRAFYSITDRLTSMKRDLKQRRLEEEKKKY